MDSGWGTKGGGPGKPPCWRTLEESCKGIGSVSLKNKQPSQTRGKRLRSGTPGGGQGSRGWDSWEGPGEGGWSRKRRDLFKTNAVWRRWWKKEQEDRVMNTRREGIVTVNL
jgi:hypothetical protein